MPNNVAVPSRVKIANTLGALAAVVASSPAIAQIGPNPAPQQAPAREALPTRQQVETPTQTETPTRRPKFVVKKSPDPGPCPLDNSDVVVNVSKVTFVPARGTELAPELVDLLTPFTSQPAGPRAIRSVCEIRDAAYRALYQAGYIASVEIPPQQITDGVLRLTVVTARIVETRVTGYDKPLPPSIAARIEAIRSLDPLRRDKAERLLLLGNDVPGLTLTLTVQPAGREPGDLIATIDVQQQSVLALLNYQNTGSDQLGPHLFSAHVAAYNLTGHADETDFGISQSSDFNEVHVFQGGHSMGIGSGGARIGVRASYALSNPTITGLDLRSKTLIAGLDLYAPLIRGLVRTGRTVDDTTVYTAGGFELLNQRSVINSAGTDVPYTRDRMRFLYGRIGAHIISRDVYGVTIGDNELLVELRKGLNILDATTRGVGTGGFQPSDPEGDPEAFEIRGTFNQTWRPFAHFRGLAFDTSIYAQWSNHPLLNLEKYSIGNLTTGRGYDPGANTGDRAVAVHTSPRVLLAQLSPNASLEGLVFYDAVRLWNLDSNTTERNRLLQSVGGGLRLNLSNRIALEATYARPLDRALTIDTRRPRDRFLISLTTQIAPWRF